MGGLYRAIIGILSVIGLFLNSRLFIGKIINEMYFVRMTAEDEKNHARGLGKKAV